MFKHIVKDIGVKSCINCKHFMPNISYENKSQQVEYGYCKLYSFLTKYSQEEFFNYAHSNRFRHDICGPEGKEFIEKS